LLGWLFLQAGLCGGALRAVGISREQPWVVLFLATFLGGAALLDRVSGRASLPPSPRSDSAAILGLVLAMAAPMVCAAAMTGRLAGVALAVGMPVAALAAVGAAAVARYLRYPLALWVGLALASGFIQVPTGISDASWLAVLGCSAPGFAIAAMSVAGGGAEERPPGRWVAAAAAAGATVAAARVWLALALRFDRDDGDATGVFVFAGLLVFPLLAPALIERCLGSTVSDADG